MKKQNPVITVVTCNINDVIKLMFQNPIIAEYINSHNLINEQLFNNDCYCIKYSSFDAFFKGHKTRVSVYLNPAMVQAC